MLIYLHLADISEHSVNYAVSKCEDHPSYVDGEDYFCLGSS